MNSVLKVIVALPAFLFLVVGLRWLVAPAGFTAEQIAVEVLVASLLVFAASRIGRTAS